MNSVLGKNMAGLVIDNLIVRFGNFEALKGISLNIKSGEFITLLGPSGCGKTTLLKTIAGFIQATSGNIELAGENINTQMPEKRDTAMCFQSYALFPHFTVAENIIFGPKQKKLPAAEQSARLQEVSRQMSLENQLSKMPTELSGGQQQRVALGRALAIQPGIMLFDEPLSNLDAKLRDSVRYEIRQLQKKLGFTAIYVTHDQAEALAMSDTVIVMNHGEVQQIGTPEEIYHYPKTRFVADFVGGANIFPAKIKQSLGNEQYLVETDIGELIVQSKLAPLHESTFVCWRPEDMVMGENERNQFTFKISTKTFLGNLTDLVLGVPAKHEIEVRAQRHGSCYVKEGEEHSFYISPKNIGFLQEAS
jgi:ABC-type Fe3+/spermidine/putrescine transport system ATPase subunit